MSKSTSTIDNDDPSNQHSSDRGCLLYINSVDKRLSLSSYDSAIWNSMHRPSHLSELL